MEDELYDDDPIEEVFVPDGKQEEELEDAIDAIEEAAPQADPANFGPIHIISIDPGFSNQGIVVANVTGVAGTNGVMNYTVHVYPDLMSTSQVIPPDRPFNEENVYLMQRMWLRKTFADPKILTERAVVLVEEAYFNPRNPALVTTSHKLCMLESTLCTILRSSIGAYVHKVKSASYKRKMQLSTGTHGANKTAVLKWAREMLAGADPERLTNHTADCLAMIHHYLFQPRPDGSVPTVEFKWGVPAEHRFGALAF